MDTDEYVCYCWEKSTKIIQKERFFRKNEKFTEEKYEWEINDCEWMNLDHRQINCQQWYEENVIIAHAQDT